MSEQLAREAIADVTTTDPVAFARAVAELPAGVLVFHGPEHVVLGANRAARAFFGDRPAIVGGPIREVYPEITGQQLYPLLERVLSTGEPELLETISPAALAEVARDDEHLRHL